MADTLLNADESRPFFYQACRSGRVFIYYRGRRVTTLKDRDAAKFIRKISGASATEAQRLMARATRNFKRGNEKSNTPQP